MAVALTQEGSFGFGLQEEQGTFTAPTVWLPLLCDKQEPAHLRLRRNYVTMDMADTNDFESRYFGVGEWTEGDVLVPFIPGSMAALLSWLQDRNQDNQGKWASLVVDYVNTVAKVTDVKVLRAKIVLEKNKPVVCRLSLVGLHHENGTPLAVRMPSAVPYQFGDATIEIATGGGQLEEDGGIERIEIVLDNMIEDPMKVATSGSPRRLRHLYNLSGVRCRGSLWRDFTDNTLHADFMAGQEVALRIELTRGASTCCVSLPRVLYTENDLTLPGSHEQRIVQRLDFIGFGSTDGLTSPIVLA